MRKIKTKESQNQVEYDIFQKKGPATLGIWTSYIWRTDPKHLAFLLARYKFCAKLLAGRKRVLEIGCGDAFGIPVLLQTVDYVLGIDFESLVIEEAKSRIKAEALDHCNLLVHDITKKPLKLNKKFDAAYSLDVIEHIPLKLEHNYMINICHSLKRHGVFIVGTPNITAQQYSSCGSSEGHINLKNAQSLKDLLTTYFYNVFLFSMNDEVVHTGFYSMAHYLLCVGVGVKTRVD